MYKKGDSVLPLGTVVTLKNDESYMIMGYKVKEEKTGKIYDYIGCDSNYGMTVKDNTFNEEDIKEVTFRGFTDPTIMKINEIIRKEENKNE